MKAIHFLFATLIFSCAVSAAERQPLPQRVDPLRLNSRTARLLEAKRERQVSEIQRSGVFHDFRFTDRRQESGISFKHNAVDDAAKNWKAAHYDHGSGLAAADVDNDGRIDLYFVNQLGGSQLWRNLGSGKFENITDTAGVGLPERFGVAAAFADIDNDGLQDLFVTTVRTGNALFRNEGGGRFREISKEAGVNYAGHSSGALFFDFNRDGLLDLFVANVGRYTTEEQGSGGFYRAYPDAFAGHLEPQRSERSILYQNIGNGRFRDVSRELGLAHDGWSGDATACDLNEDGFPDLYVLNMQGDDRYYENQGGTNFVEKTAALFPKTPWGAMGVKVFDHNRDGHPDLYITDMHSDMTDVQTQAGKRDFSEKFETAKSDPWCSVEWSDEFLQGASNNIFGNALYTRSGKGYAEISGNVGVETYWPWGPSVGDLNADGFEDIFVTAGMGYPFRYAPNNLLLNENGSRFIAAEFAVGVEPRQAGFDIEYFTLDCSGQDKEHTICYHRKGILSVIGSTSARSSVLVDIDDDGDLDLVTNEMNDSPQILISDLSERRKVKFLKLRLIGTRSNRDGVGGRVKVSAGNAVMTQWRDGKSGYLAQSSLPLYFGLGEAESINEIEVLWPSGRRQIVRTGLQLNALITLTEPAN